MGVERVVIKSGSGLRPRAGDIVEVLASGFLATGKKFWPIQGESEPFSFCVGRGQVIRGWDEGVMQMEVGEKARLHVTSDYAYGSKGFPEWGIKPGDSLVFEIELLQVK
ncbi:putative FKBP type peptidyl prolyl cis trans isomerase [Trypanosoma vivax]|uniref:peptidylprolyl isomerase n=1 Tax=Trypanosoma vivax (strain Y486) TaxID=1055687 RepID=G0U6B0_TRYVY|nr:putative peptidyl-prolyl cis-trans isomerase [Trypanosoma vivax]KAH8611872.1 putative FKBP type peptidyl prolyl cis trans isomerase [Trypanosoma vivax]CCC51413.1 putative peptidyl-prolyl cis-trans isomerase [Trypanosoma vivax Y486]